MGSDVRIVNGPDSVFLCYGVDKEIGDIDHNECTEVAWSDERIFDTDVEYVRSDRLNALEAERDALREALETITSKGNLWNADPDTYTGGTKQMQGKAYDVVRDMYAIATQALTKGGLDSCDHACGPSDYHEGGKCDKNGCYTKGGGDE